MLTITIDGSATGRTYYGLSHALPVARRMATIRARRGQHPVIAVIEVGSGAVVVPDVTQPSDPHFDNATVVTTYPTAHPNGSAS